MLYSHMKEWRRNWMLVNTPQGSPRLREPVTPTVKLSEWASCAAGEAFEPVLQCIKIFMENGLDGRMVAISFARLRIAPLQARWHLVWSFEALTGPPSMMRT